jgi:excisionase family DNA binding protein
MVAITPALLGDLADASRKGDRNDLTARLLTNTKADVLTSTEAAALLGVASPNTVKNWLQGGYFPGAFKTAGGHWRFPREEVEAVRFRLNDLRDRNSRRDLMPADCDDDIVNPPLS